MISKNKLNVMYMNMKEKGLWQSHYQSLDLRSTKFMFYSDVRHFCDLAINLILLWMAICLHILTVLGILSIESVFSLGTFNI